MKVLLCVLGLLLSFELVAGSLEWFELSKSDHDHSGLVVRETRDRATSEIVNELRQRRSAGSPPNDTSKFTFDGDSNNNGIISYSYTGETVLVNYFLIFTTHPHLIIKSTNNKSI